MILLLEIFFLLSLTHLLQTIERLDVFWKYMVIYVFKFSIFIANNAIDFYHFSLFRFYWKYFNIVLSFLSYSVGENKLEYSKEILPFNMKLINPIQKYSHIIESYACIL